MLADSYGQGLPYLDETDAPDLNVWGSALVGAVGGQLVMRFASTSARDATLTGATAPVAGMRCYVSATDTFYSYTTAHGWVPEQINPTVPWTAPALNTAGGISDNGNGEGATGFRVVPALGQQRLELQGGVNLGTDPGSGNTILLFTLPLGARPTARRTVVAGKNQSAGLGVTKVDINTDGTVNAFGTGGTGSTTTWVSLNGIAVYL